MTNAHQTLVNLVSNRVLDLENFYNVTIETQNRLNLQATYSSELAYNIKTAFKGANLTSELTDNGYIQMIVSYFDTTIRITLT